MTCKLQIMPISIRQADKFIEVYHRHNKKAGNGKFAIACYNERILVGVSIGGRPRSRHLDNGKTFEVYRVCTDGTRNATSFLYARMKRIAQLMGYLKSITYSLQTEKGSSLKAIGAIVEKSVHHNRQWNNYGKIKRSSQTVTTEPKYRWSL